MQYFIKVKFRRLLAVIGHCQVWIDYKIRKHYSTRFGRYCVLSTKHHESIYFAIKALPVSLQRAPTVKRDATLIAVPVPVPVPVDTGCSYKTYYMSHSLLDAHCLQIVHLIIFCPNFKRSQKSSHG